MLYGRLAQILSGAPPAFSISVSGATRSASPAITSSRPGQCAPISASAPSARESRSIAITFLAPSSNSARVRPPGPGPTSTTTTPPSGPAARAILRVRLRSNRKFWPSALRASSRCAATTSLKRRQSVRGEGHRVNRSASLTAAMRLAGLARPFPAISKAVPWSGEVRTNGRPSVTLTPSSKASVLTGMRPWS